MFADTIIYSNNIFTSTSDHTISGGIAIKDDSIIFVGSRDETEVYTGPETKILDVENNFVCPGFIDNHLHFVMSSMGRSRFCAFVDGDSPQECISKLSSVEDVRDKSKPLFGFGWYQPKWKNPVLPNKEMIDEIYPNRPVVMQAMDGHSMWLNSKGLEYFGIHNDSIPPKGGIYRRDENGELTGIIQEQAATGLLADIFDYTEGELLEGTTEFMDYLAKNGITSVNDVAALAIPGSDFVREDIYKILYDQDKLKCRINMFPQGLMDLTRPLNMIDEFENNKYVKFCGLKQFFDGVSPSHTAWLHEDYQNARFEGDSGNPVIPVSYMKEIVFNANAKGIGVRIHTIGDKAITTAIDIFKESQELYGHPIIGHNGLEHLENLMPSDIDRLAKYDLCANVQPPHLVLDMDTIDEDLGVGRAALMWPFATMQKAGVDVSFGSDSPVVDCDYRGILYTSITRQNPFDGHPAGGWLPQEKVSPSDAIINYTLKSAKSAGRNLEVGSIEKDKLADIVILDTNLLTCEPEEILTSKVLYTILGGKTVYKAE